MLMNTNPMTYHSLTSEQLDEWRQLAVREERLQRDLQAVTLQRDELIKQYERLHAAYDSAVAEWREHAADLQRSIDTQTRDASQSYEQLMVLAALVEPVLVEWVATYEVFAVSALNGEMQERLQGARQALDLVDELIS
jgi:uncharacterized protein YukE